MRKINRAGIDLIKRWEGLKTKAYRDPIGVLTIGYGHTSQAGLPRVTEGMTISLSQAEQILRKDLTIYEAAVVQHTQNAPCTDNQFAAMTSLCYNIGPGNFERSSVAAAVARGDAKYAATRFAPWNKAGGKVLRGLSNRRADETRLFKTPDGARMPASPRDKAAGAGALVSGAGAAAKAVQEGLVATDVAVLGFILLAFAIGAVIYMRKKKT